jgi:ABC-type glycerol-3-phosphate transport system substrate-binding protein
MSQKKLTRRTFLAMSGGAGAAAFLAACGAPAAPAPAPAAPAATEAPMATEAAAPTEAPAAPPTEAPTAVPTAAPRSYGEGTEIVVWYQDWDGANRIMGSITPAWVEQNPGAKVTLQAIGYSDLFSKLLPSIAAGTEGDVLNMYTDWIVGTDVKQVFLDVTDPVGGAAKLSETMWPAAFTAIDVPEGKVYYFPWLAGIRGAAMTVNKDHLAEQNIDYLNLKSFEEVVDAAVKITKKNDAGKITRAGYSPRSSQYQLLWSLIWQLGGNMFDKEKGKWTHSTPEGQQAAQIIYDVYWKQETCDFDLFTDEYAAVSQKLVSIWGDGAWTAGVQTDTAGVPADNIVTPYLANAKAQVLFPQHMAGFGLSKRLASDPTKTQLAVSYAEAVVGPDALIQAFDFYSGVCMTKTVYADPRIETVKYGLMSKRVAEGMWPVARYTQDHVANQGPAATELERAMRKEISIEEALNNMDSYLQEQEDSARERIGI